MLRRRLNPNGRACAVWRGTALWCRYVIGTICTLVSQLMVTSLAFQERMDMLSEYMSFHQFPSEMRKRANAYNFYTASVRHSCQCGPHPPRNRVRWRASEVSRVAAI